MNEQPQKIDESTLAEIRMLQGKFQELTVRMGTLGIEKMELEDRELKIKSEWQSVKKMDEDLRDKIVNKYGEGRLNPDDGTFISTQSNNWKKPDK